MRSKTKKRHFDLTVFGSYQFATFVSLYLIRLSVL